MKRKGLHPIILVGGVVAIVLIFLLFVPSILGATAAQNDLEKYNGTSQQGNDTARISGVLDRYLIGVSGLPLTWMAWFVALFAVIVVILWAFKRH